MASPKFCSNAEAENKGELYATFMTSNGHELVSDELQQFGGKNLGPSPGDYLCMSLASCKVITLRMYIQRKQWKVGRIHAKVNLVEGKYLASGMNTFYCEISITGDINAAQQRRLEEIAKICPITRLLGKQNEVIIKLSNHDISGITKEQV